MIRERIGKEKLFFDGAMGTSLQKVGLKVGEVPELFNFTHPELVQEVHRDYLEAGSDFITTNTFGANKYKVSETSYTVDEVIGQAVAVAKEAIKGFEDKYIALDIGSTGKLLAPMGDVEFEEIYEVFKEQAIAGEKHGCDVILLETFTDLYELKAGVLAVKENTKLPVFCTMSFEPNMRTFFGTSLESMILMLEGLGVDALGINCSLGPKELMPVVQRMMELASIPVMVQPNAGLPVVKDGKATYNITSDEFAEYTSEFAKLGVSILGGCCGTNAEYISKTVKKVRECKCEIKQNPRLAGVCTPTKAVFLDSFKIVGERINPSNKPYLEQALREEDWYEIVQEAIVQQSEGAHILDVNVGSQIVSELEALPVLVREIQSMCALPLQIDSTNTKAIEAAVRIYNGKPIINSVTGCENSLETILPLVKKYGTAVIALTLDENGLPKTASERVQIAKKIIRRAAELGIPKEDIIIDCLVLTGTMEGKHTEDTLEALKLVKKELGVKTILGISNSSFRLPNRSLVNRTLLASAMMNGLDLAILNPADENLHDTISAAMLLKDEDTQGKMYIEKYR